MSPDFIQSLHFVIILTKNEKHYLYTFHHTGFILYFIMHTLFLMLTQKDYSKVYIMF